MPRINFNKVMPSAGVTGHDPSSSVKAIPEWYRKMAKYINGNKKPDGHGSFPLTIKACPPFLDAMMSGYTIYTEYDMHVTQNEDGPWFEWRAGGDLISTHGKEQIVPEQVPEGYSDQPLKFNNGWQIVTPKGYSTMFMHPINRTELPFFTISGVVETDTYKPVINFPFLVKKDFEGIIPAGTPIVQVFPFKREAWKIEIGDANLEEIEKSQLKLNHKFIGGYKSQWWQRKEYK